MPFGGRTGEKYMLNEINIRAFLKKAGTEPSKPPREREFHRHGTTTVKGLSWCSPAWIPSVLAPRRALILMFL